MMQRSGKAAKSAHVDKMHSTGLKNFKTFLRIPKLLILASLGDGTFKCISFSTAVLFGDTKNRLTNIVNRTESLLKISTG